MKPWHYIILGILFGLIFSGLLLLVIQAPPSQSIALTSKETPGNLLIHIAGAIRNPGVYELELNSRVMDAVNASGGFQDDADLDRVNLAKKLIDGEQIYIPSIGEERKLTDEEIVGGDTGITSSAPLNINIASIQELEQLPGIGPTKAEEIVAYREENGWFLTIEDIMNVPGIGPTIFENMKELITVE